MSSTNFVDLSPATPIVAAWLNDVNKATYNAIGDGTLAPTTHAQVLANLGLSATGGAALVGYQSALAGSVARNVAQKISEMPSVLDFGAVGNGTANDAAAFTGTQPYTAVPAGTYRISTNTVVPSSLLFSGGQITVDSGVTLTINGSINAPDKIIFLGLGTVICASGETNIAWFNGTDASSCWAFAARGMQNTNGLGNIAVFPKLPATDPRAVIMQISGNGVWGPRWRVDAPIVIDSPQQQTVIRTPSGFVATTAMQWMWQLGTSANTLKVDYIHFPDKLSIEGNNGTCTYAGIMYGSSHMRIPYQEIYRTAGWLMQPTQNKQISDVKFDFIDTGFLYGPVLTLDGSNGANNTITDFVCDFINSTGFATGHAPNALVQMNSNYNNITIGRVVHRAVTAGTVDATGSVVSLTNVGATPPGGVFYPPRYGIRIGPVLNGSTTIAAKAIAFSDQSVGVAAKFAGITIEAGSLVDGGALANDISLDYTNSIVVQGLTNGRVLAISSTCVNTQVYGISPANITDGSASTLINGKSKLLITSVAPTTSPMTYVNNNVYDVDFQIQGVTAITSATYTRNGTPVSVTAGGTAGWWRVSPGDNIAVAFTGAISAANVIPR
jgi:hypothetical protein